ncbi:MAG TPA: DsbC family protein [Burkholderiales bacterium]|nr:DsbC family protein [Burkholderiales bacterium]
MFNRIATLLVLLCALAPFALHAQGAEEALVKQVLLAKFPKLSVESVTRMPFAGLYEVVMGGEIVYTDSKAEFMMGGTLYDIRTLPARNITQDTQQKVASKLLTTSHDSAIKTVRGNGKRVLYTFEDPNCGYCKELYKELGKMTDVTVYTFLLPILSPDSTEKARAIWCSKDRAKAWDQMMTKGGLSEQPKPCAAPLEKNTAMAQHLNIRGTPAIYLASGQQLGGYVPAQQIEQAFVKK